MVQDENLSVENAIGFAISTTETRGELGFSSNDFGSMGVFAFYTQGDWDDHAAPAPNVMFNQLVEKMGTGWNYSPVKYWPEDTTDKLSFFAYAPYNAQGLTTSSAGQSGYPQLFYAVPAMEKQQADLLVADPQMNLMKQGSQVPFTMRHALTKVSVYVQCSGTFNASSLSIKAPKSGTLTFNKTGFDWQTGDELQNYVAALSSQAGEQTGRILLATFFLLPKENVNASLSAKYIYTPAGNQSGEVAELDKELPVSSWKPGTAVAYVLELSTVDGSIESVRMENPQMEWTGTDKNIEYFDPKELKPGDYYYNDGSCTDGGLRKIEDGVYVFDDVYPHEGVTTFEPPYPNSGKECIGVLFFAGQGLDDDSPEIKGYVLALHNTDVAFFAKKKVSDSSSGASRDISDFRGFQNTGYFRANIGNYPLAETCSYYSPADESGNSTGWFIPSYAQMQSVWNGRMTYLDAALQRAGGVAISEAGDLWTSTEAGNSTQYMLVPQQGKIVATSKRTKAATRLVLAF